jgi:hypothetical protein
LVQIPKQDSFRFESSPWAPLSTPNDEGLQSEFPSYPTNRSTKKKKSKVTSRLFVIFLEEPFQNNEYAALELQEMPPLQPDQQPVPNTIPMHPSHPSPPKTPFRVNHPTSLSCQAPSVEGEESQEHDSGLVHQIKPSTCSSEQEPPRYARGTRAR